MSKGKAVFSYGSNTCKQLTGRVCGPYDAPVEAQPGFLRDFARTFSRYSKMWCEHVSLAPLS